MGIILGELFIFGLGFALGAIYSDSSMAKSVREFWAKVKNALKDEEE